MAVEMERVRLLREEELRRYEQLQAEAEAEVEAEAQAELEQQRIAEEQARAEREAAEQRRRAEEERQRVLEEEQQRAHAEQQRAHAELLRQQEKLATSPVSFTDATSRAIFAFFAHLIAHSLHSPRPFTPSADTSSDTTASPTMCKRLDTGVEGYVVKTPHASSHSDSRSQAWTLLHDLLALAPLPVLHEALRVPALLPAYQSAVLSALVRLLLLGDGEVGGRWLSLLVSSSTFAQNFAQVLCVMVGKMRAGMWRGGGLLLMELTAKWLSSPTLLSILSSAPPPPNAKKSPDDNRRTAHCLLASLHSSTLLVYAEGLGLDLYSATPSSRLRREKRNPRQLLACNAMVLAHRDVVLGVLVQQEKQHAYVACLLHSLLQQLWKDEDMALSPRTAIARHQQDWLSTASPTPPDLTNGHTDEVSWAQVRASAVKVLIAMFAYPRAVAYVTAILSGKHTFTSLASSSSPFLPLPLVFPPSLFPPLAIGLNMLHRGDEANFPLWAAHSQAELAPALAASLGVLHAAFVQRMEGEKRETRGVEEGERGVREAGLRARCAKVDAARVEVGLRVRLLEADVKERRVKAEQEKKREERKEKKVNAKMLKKKLEMTRKTEEMRERREEEVERRKAQRPLGSVQWNALASASAVDDRQQWKAQLAHALALNAAQTAGTST